MTQWPHVGRFTCYNGNALPVPLLGRTNFPNYFLRGRGQAPAYIDIVTAPPVPPSTETCADDERLARPARAEGFRQLYTATLEPLRRYLGRLLGSRTEAQDVAQDAFLRLHLVMREREIDRPQAYLFTTARRLAIDELRRRSGDPLRHAEADLDQVLAREPAVETVVMARSEMAALMEDINRLPPGCRAVFLLSRMENMTHIQIGHRLGISPSTVEKQHARALRLLRELRTARQSPPNEPPRSPTP